MSGKGFTLVELVIVVAILGLLAAIAIPNFSTMVSRSKEAAVKSNGHTVQIAAEDFALQNDGVYAEDVDSDQTLGGMTILALLPNAVPLENPFTKARTEPVNGPASNPGEVGYASIQENGVEIGYTITAVGVIPNTVILALIAGQ